MVRYSILLAFIFTVFEQQESYGQFPPCHSGILNVPVVQCIDSGDLAIIEFIPGSELMPPNGYWYLSFQPIQGQSTGGSGFQFPLSNTFPNPFLFDNTLNGHLDTIGHLPIGGRWNAVFATAYEFGVPCQDHQNQIEFDFRSSSSPCGQGTPLWIAASTHATTAVCDGAVIVEVFNGTPPFTFTFSTGQIGSDSTASNLCEGLYSISVEDAIGNTANSTFFIVEDQFVYNDPLIASLINPDTLYTSASLFCDIDYNLPIDSFEIQSVVMQGVDTLIAEWVVWQQGSPFTVFGEYPNNGSGTPVLAMTIYCLNGRSEHGGFQLYAIAENISLGFSTSLNDDSIQLYPNPTKDEFNVQIQSAEPYLVRISNLLGQSIIELPSLTGNQGITLTGKSGIYFVEITTKSGQRAIKRVIKQ